MRHGGIWYSFFFLHFFDITYFDQCADYEAKRNIHTMQIPFWVLFRLVLPAFFPLAILYDFERCSFDALFSGERVWSRWKIVHVNILKT